MSGEERGRSKARWRQRSGSKDDSRNEQYEREEQGLGPAPVNINLQEMEPSLVHLPRRDINQDLSEYLDYLLEYLEPDSQANAEAGVARVKEESPDPAMGMVEVAAAPAPRKDIGRGHLHLLKQLDSANRQKLALIREACGMAVSMQHIRQAAAGEEGVQGEDELVIMPKSWVKEAMELFKEASPLGSD